MGYKTKEACAAYARMRYKTDLAWREREKARSRANYAANPEKAIERSKKNQKLRREREKKRKE